MATAKIETLTIRGVVLTLTEEEARDVLHSLLDDNKDSTFGTYHALRVALDCDE